MEFFDVSRRTIYNWIENGVSWGMVGLYNKWGRGRNKPPLWRAPPGRGKTPPPPPPPPKMLSQHPSFNSMVEH